MVSIGPNNQSYNFTHMFDIPDLRGDLPTKINDGTILELLSKTEDLSMFYNLAIICNFDDILNSYDANFTIFAPSNSHILEKYGTNIFEDFDFGDARKYIKASTVDNKISSELLEDGSYLYTIDKVTRIYIRKNSYNIRLNDNINLVYSDILCKNGVVHITDDKISVRDFC